jgi:hypothetical protein
MTIELKLILGIFFAIIVVEITNLSYQDWLKLLSLDADKGVVQRALTEYVIN